MNPQKHLKRFKRQCVINANQSVLLLKNAQLSLQGIAFDWYYLLQGVIIPTCTKMEIWFLKKQIQHWNYSTFLRNVVEFDVNPYESSFK